MIQRLYKFKIDCDGLFQNHEPCSNQKTFECVDDERGSMPVGWYPDGSATFCRDCWKRRCEWMVTHGFSTYQRFLDQLERESI